MILLDTDHLSVLKFRASARAIRLSSRIEKAASDGSVGTTIVNVEEAMRGWISAIAKEKDVARQAFAYRELAELFTFFSGFSITVLDDDAIQNFTRLKQSKIRIGTMDLKIASISLAQDALLLTANTQDFELVPGLRFENWLD